MEPRGWMERVATSLVKAMRITSSNSLVRVEYEGNAYQPGVSVCWAWLTLLTFLVALSIVSLSSVVGENGLQ